MKLSNNQNYGVITPAKNEEATVRGLVQTMANQLLVPKVWVFVNDSSIDNTKLYLLDELKKHPEFESRCMIIILDYIDKEQGYALGEKYSRVVKFGMEHLQRALVYQNLDFVGVLDCDILLPETYYADIIERFGNEARLGIASAGSQIEHDEGSVINTKVNRSHAPGGFRVWRRECLMDTGYTPSVSQDAVSEARAIMMNWKVKSFPELEITMRKRGAKYGFDYYGKSAYVRRVPFSYVLLGAFRLVVQNRLNDGKQYIKGYKQARLQGHSRIKDKLATKYFRSRLYYRLLGK